MYLNERGISAALFTLFAMMAVAVWVTRGKRKYTREGERDLLVTFVVGITLAALFVVSSCSS